jgi:asparagine synthase (glutamine-hydrolysing)
MHRPLSIIDVAGGSQPMSSPDKRFHTTFNGEILSHLELKEDWTTAQDRWRCRSRSPSLGRAWIDGWLQKSSTNSMHSDA